MTNPRATLQFLTPRHGDLMATLDAVSAADFLVFSVSAETEVDRWGETCIRSVASLGAGEGTVRALVSVRAVLLCHLRLPTSDARRQTGAKHIYL